MCKLWVAFLSCRLCFPEWEWVCCLRKWGRLAGREGLARWKSASLCGLPLLELQEMTRLCARGRTQWKIWRKRLQFVLLFFSYVVLWCACCDACALRFVAAQIIPDEAAFTIGLPANLRIALQSERFVCRIGNQAVFYFCFYFCLWLETQKSRIILTAQLLSLSL